MSDLDGFAPLLLLGAVLVLAVVLWAAVMPLGLRWTEQLLLLGLQVR